MKAISSFDQLRKPLRKLQDDSRVLISGEKREKKPLVTQLETVGEHFGEKQACAFLLEV